MYLNRCLTNIHKYPQMSIHTLWLLPIREHFWRQRSIPDSHTFMAYVMAGGLLSCLLRGMMAFFISSIIELQYMAQSSNHSLMHRIHSHRICAGPFLSCAGGPCRCCKWGPSCSTNGVISLDGWFSSALMAYLLSFTSILLCLLHDCTEGCYVSCQFTLTILHRPDIVSHPLALSCGSSTSVVDVVLPASQVVLWVAPVEDVSANLCSCQTTSLLRPRLCPRPVVLGLLVSMPIGSVPQYAV